MIYLKELNSKNVNKTYLEWMNDKEIQQFTEQRYKKHTIKKIKIFFNKKKKSKNEILYGIFTKKNKLHIGNIKLGPTNFKHQTSEISYFIGDKNFWNKGYATKAIKEIIIIARQKKIKKLTAGFYKENVASKKILEKNNFKLEAKFRSQYIIDGKRTDGIIYGLIL